MRVWLGIVLGGMLLMAAWGLPPRTGGGWFEGGRGDRQERTPEREAFIRAQAEVGRRNWLYQRLQWRDSVAGLARASEENGRMWAVALPAWAPDSLLRGLEAAVLAQLDAEGVSVPAVPVGVMLMEGDVGTHPSIGQPGSISFLYREVVASRDPGRPFCYLVDPVRGSERFIRADWARMVWQPADSSSSPAPLGPCALHARYGTPGPGISRWLDSGGYAFAVGASGGWVGLDPAWPRQRRPRAAFGGMDAWDGTSPEGRACLLGRIEGCRRALFGDRDARPGGGAWRESVSPEESAVAVAIQEFDSQLRIGREDYHLLRDLEREFGSDRFHRFWASEQDVEEAFRAVFGVPFPDWVMAWARSQAGRVEPTPVVAGSASFLSLLTIGGLAGAALYLGRRRG